MAITVNEGGVLKELDTIPVNEGSVLYELDTVHSNEGGALYEIFSGKGYPEELVWYSNPNKTGVIASSDNGMTFYKDGTSAGAQGWCWFTLTKKCTVNLTLKMHSESIGSGVSIRNPSSNIYIDEDVGSVTNKVLSTTTTDSTKSTSTTLDAGNYIISVFSGYDVYNNSTGSTVGNGACPVTVTVEFVQ